MMKLVRVDEDLIANTYKVRASNSALTLMEALAGPLIRLLILKSSDITYFY